MIHWHWDVYYMASCSRISIHPLLSLQGTSKLHSSFHCRRTSKRNCVWKSNPKPQVSHNRSNSLLYLPSPSLKPTHLYHNRFRSVGKLTFGSDRSIPFSRGHVVFVQSYESLSHTLLYSRGSLSHLLNWLKSSCSLLEKHLAFARLTPLLSCMISVLLL